MASHNEFADMSDDEAAAVERKLAHVSYMESLNCAHNTSMLVYSRSSESEELSRKLRAEVKKLYMTHEVPEATWLIEKNNNDPDNPGIGLIVADYDKTTLNLLEFLRKRAADPATKHLPAILVILIVGSDVKTDVKDTHHNVEVLRGVSSKVVFDQVLGLIKRHTELENAYRELRQATHNAKYPFLPIFTASKQQDNGSSDDDDKDLDRDDDDDDDDFNESLEGITEQNSLAEGQSQAEASVGTEDDWTNASSMLPSFVKTGRDASAKATAVFEDAPDWRKSNEKSFRVKLDKNMEETMNKELKSQTILPSRGSRPSTVANSISKIELENQTAHRDGRDLRANQPILVDHHQKNLVDRISQTAAATIRPPRKLGSRQSSIGGLDADATSKCWTSLNNRENFKAQEAEKEQKPAAILPTQKMAAAVGNRRNDIDLKQGKSKVAKEILNPVNFESVKGDMKNSSQLTVAHAVHNLSKDKAKKLIVKLTRDAPVDVELGRIKELNIAERKMSAGERSHLLRGCTFMEVEEWEPAIASFVRVAKKSKQPHLPFICIGVIRFRQKKYMAAVEAFAKAHSFLYSMKRVGQSHPEDEFTALYNRALSYFRLGNDHAGIADLEEACKAHDCEEGRHCLILALRRMGDYHGTIDNSLKLRSLEHKNAEAEEMKRDLPKKSSGMHKLRPSSAKERHILMMEEIDKLAAPEGMTHDIHHMLEGGSTYSDLNAHEFISEEDSHTQTNPSASHIDGPASGSLPPMTHIQMHHSRARSKASTKQAKAVNIDVKKNEKVSFSDRKKKAVSAISATEDQGLLTFMITHGFKGSLHNSLYQRMTPLIESLLQPSQARSKDDLLEIINSLRLVPFLRNVDPQNIARLANVVDFVSVTTRGPLLIQNNLPQYVCFILDGKVSYKLSGRTFNTQYLPIGELGKGEGFGHIDALFGPDLDIDEIRAMFHSKDATFKLEEDMTEEEEKAAILNMRTMRATSFATYSVAEPSQLLLIPIKYFNSLLATQAKAELAKRINIVEACGAFNEWTWYEKLRLARMGTLRTVSQGSVLVRQGESPDNVSLVVKGMLRVLKRQNRTEILGRKLQEVQHQIAFHDAKYTFHHKIRHELSEKTREEYPVVPEVMKYNTHLTRPEIRRHEMGFDVQKLAKKLARAEIDEKEAEEQREASLKLEDVEDEAAAMERNHCEIKVLEYPQVFGESCLLNLESGASLGTIIADTLCELFVIHKYQLQTFHVGDHLMERVETRSIAYPSDDVLISTLEHRSRWGAYRAELLDKIPKARWPTRADDVEPWYACG